MSYLSLFETIYEICVVLSPGSKNHPFMRYPPTDKTDKSPHPLVSGMGLYGGVDVDDVCGTSAARALRLHAYPSMLFQDGQATKHIFWAPQEAPLVTVDGPHGVARKKRAIVDFGLEGMGGLEIL